MATYSSLLSTTTAFIPNKPRLSFAGNHRKPDVQVARRSSPSISCSGGNNYDDEKTKQEQQTTPKLDRRNVLLGLGGLYSATTLDTRPFASAAPIPAPDFTTCQLAEITTGGTQVQCCPPETTTIKTFTPDRTLALRTRPAAHLVTDEYLNKFKKAVALMRALPDDDPRSFTQQAKVHCAYCNGAYPETGFSDIDIQVHFCWTFFPFHRMYLYFFEKILGKLIDDPTFAIPYWNWDAPAGYQIPAMYDDSASPLYDALRNQSHRPPTLVDLGYSGTDDDADEATQTAENLAIMYKTMVSGAKNPTLFFGGERRAGDSTDTQSPGTIEAQPHTAIHIWSGSTTTTNGENMGNFYSAGRDPLFYGHHGNVDRMWNIWKTLGGKRKDFTDSDWLNTEFLFYDENAELVKCKVSDSLEPIKDLRYDYEQVSIPWLFKKPTARKPKKVTKAKVSASQLASKFPVTLDKAITVEVARPKTTKRSQTDKDDEEEVLVVKGIEFDSTKPVKFDVYINDDADSLSKKNKSEFVGSFSSVPHQKKGGDTKMKTNLKLAITELLEDLGAENDKTVLVTLVPRFLASTVTIGGLAIEFSA